MTHNWAQMREVIAAADGDEWDRLAEEYDEAWKAAWCDAFRAVAASRGWSQENIESGWLDAANDALVEKGWTGADPAAVAAQDVVECEMKAWNA